MAQNPQTSEHQPSGSGLSEELPGLLPGRSSPHRRGWMVVTKGVVEGHPEEEQFVAMSELAPGALEGVMGLFSQRLESLSGRISELSSEVSALSQKVQELSTRATDLEEEIAERPDIRTAFLSELGSREHALSTPVAIVLEEYDNETIARWPEVEAAGAGASELEAVLGLKQDIIALYEDLRSTPRSELGAEAAAALSILKATITKKRG